MAADETDGAPKPRGRFQPGVSGNPSGRPRQPKSAAEVKQLARQHTVGAMETLVRVYRNPKAPFPSRVQAATEILNRGWGKPSGDFTEGAEALVIKVLKFADPQFEEQSEMKTIEGEVVDDKETN